VLSEVDFGFGGSDLGQDNPSDVSTIGVKVRIYTFTSTGMSFQIHAKQRHAQPPQPAAIHVDRPDMKKPPSHRE